MNIMKKILSYVIALVPILLLISLLFLLPIVFLISLVPNNYLPTSPIWIIEGLIGILILGYGIRLNRFPINLKDKKVYWAMFILSIIIATILALYFKNLLIISIFCQLFLLITYVLIFEQRFTGFKTYLQRSRSALVVFNLFDTFFVLLYYFLKYIIRNNKDKIDNFLNELPITYVTIEWIFIILSMSVLFILLPAFRGYLSVWFYKKQNGIHKQSGRVFWNSNITAYGVSIMSLCLYISMFFRISSLNDSRALVYLMLMSFTVYFWTIVCEGIDRRGEDKEKVLSNWALIGLLSIFLILLDQIESDLIGILTWFLPMLLPTFIGKVNSIIPKGYSKSPTPFMKKHLYWLQMMSFNTLFIFNIISSISTKQLIKNEKIEQINELKIFLISLFDSESSSNFASGVLVSSTMLLISIAVAYGLSKLIVYLIRRYYIEASNRYFN